MRLKNWTVTFILLQCLFVASAQNNLVNINATPSTDGERVNLQLSFSDTLTSAPKVFTMANPERLIFDFSASAHSIKQPLLLSHALVTKMTVLQGEHRVRLVVDLVHPADYSIRLTDKTAYIDFYPKPVTGGSSSALAKSSPLLAESTIDAINFKHGKQVSSGQLIFSVSQPQLMTSMEQVANLVKIKFFHSHISPYLHHLVNVANFGTPIQRVTFQQENDDVIVNIENKGPYEYNAHQMNNQFIIDIIKPQANITTNLPASRMNEKLSLDFRSIGVRDVLQLLAEFADLNLVVSDQVQGDITLHLNDIPWHQALDIVLKSRGLLKRIEGNVLFIAPQEQVMGQEEAAAKLQEKAQTMAPLHTESFKINYGKVDDFYALLKDSDQTLLSARGHAVKLSTTNTIVVEDTAQKLQNIRSLFKQMDVPVKQVLIEARIVFVRKSFERNLGVDWNLHRQGGRGILQQFSMDLPAEDIGATYPAKLALGRVAGDVLLDLELSALEAEGNAELIASPRLMTSNNVTASIEQGTQIPYQTSALNGGTTVTLVDAALRLEVTPQITPSNKLLLELSVTQDRPGESLAGSSQPPIDTRKIKTHVMIDNGETIVLGGVYEQDKRDIVTRVPFLGSIPVVGHLFSSTKKSDIKTELLIFITPRITDEKTEE